MQIGDRIKTKRKEANLTIKKMHELSGLSIGSISDIENNKYAPSISSLLSLSKTLKCSIDWIVTGDNFKEDNHCLKFQNFEILDNDERELLTNFRKLNARDKVDILETTKNKLESQLKPELSLTSSSGETSINDNRVG